MKTSTLRTADDNQSQVSTHRRGRAWRPVALALAASLAAANVLASNIYKANNTDDLDLASSWTNALVPGAGDVATWDSTVTGANSTVLGADLSWGGLGILDPGGAVTINATTASSTSGATLTLGAGGIDMPHASQSLTINAPVTLLGQAVQSWTIGSGLNLALGAGLTRSAGAALRFNLASGATVNVAGGTADSVLHYSVLNGTDVGALDASKNVAAAADVMNSLGAYRQNVAGGDPFVNGGDSSTNYLDVVNANSSGDDVDIGGVRYIPLVRFNTVQPYRNYWVYNVGTHVNETASPASTYLVTTNIGAEDVIIEAHGSGHVFRWNNSNDELILDQENTAGTLYVNGPATQRNGGGTLTKLGAGRVVWNANFPNTGPINVVEGEFMANQTTTASSAVRIGNRGVLSGSATIQGPLTINAGGFVHPGTTNGLGAITVSGSVTIESGGGLEFYSASTPMNNSSALLNLTSGLTVSGSVVISVIAGAPAVGQFPLIHWTNAIPAAVFTNFTLSFTSLRPISGYLSNNVANDSVDLVVTSVDEPIKWSAGDGTWDVNQTANWVDQLGASTSYQQNNGLSDSVLFDDSASGTSPITVTLNATPTPASVTVNNSTKNYSLTGTGGVAGNAPLTKLGSGSLTLSTSNSFAGGVNLNGGVVTFSSLQNLGTGPINFGGGTLQYASGTVDDISSNIVTFNAGGGTIDDGGNTVNFGDPIGNGGAGGFTKTGAGTLTLNGTNNYFGDTVVNQGTLALAYPAYIPDSANIIVNSGAVLDAETSGIGLTLNSSANQTLAGTGTVNGEIASGVNTAISPASNGTFGTLSFGNDLTVNGGTLIMDVSATNRDLIAVTGGLALSGGTLHVNLHGTLNDGNYKLISFGFLSSGAGSSGTLTLSGFSEAGHSAYLIDTSTEVDLVVAPAASDNITWSGTAGATWDLAGTMNWLLNGTTPWSFTNGDFATFNDTGSSQSSVSLQDSVRPGSVTVSSSANYTFQDGTGTGGGKISGSSGLVKSGTGTLTINTPDDNSGGLLINSGTVQVGGNIGTGNVTNNGALVFQQSANASVAGQISGSGSLIQQGLGTLMLDKDNTYTGPTTISSGALQLGNGLTGTGSLGTGNVTNNGGLIFNRSSSAYSVANSITGSGSLVKLDAAAVTFGGNLTYQGDTSISNGVFVLSANNQIPSAATVAGSTGSLVLDGGTSAGMVDLAGHNLTVNALSGAAGTVNGAITNTGTSGTNTLIVLGTAATTYNGGINENPSGAKVQLVLMGTNSLDLVGANTYSAGTILGNGASVNTHNSASLGTGPVTINNGASLNIVANSTIGNTITTVSGATAKFTGVYDGDYYTASFNGDNTTTDVFTGKLTWNSGGMFNNYNGTVTLVGDPTANDVRLFPHSNAGTPVGGTNAILDMEGCTLHEKAGDSDTIIFGALTGSGLGIISADTPTSGSSTFIFGAKGLNTTYGGTLTGPLSFVKDGTGTLTLFGTNETIALDAFGNTITNVSLLNETTFTGTLTVTNGVLVVRAPNNLNDTTAGNPQGFVLAGNNAVLDLSSMGSSPDGLTLQTNSTLTLSVNSVGTNQALSGFGTILGSVNASSPSSTVAVGLPFGALTVSNSIEVGGTLTMNVSLTNTPNSSELISPAITLDSGAMLIVTNLGPEAAGKFQLFSHAVNTTGVTIVLPTLTGTNTWQNDLAVDGSLTLIAPKLVTVNTNPAPISITQAPGTLTLSWPPDHLGWTLQTQTNAPGVGLGTNWVDVTGSTGTTNMTFNIGTTNGSVFFRMVYP